MSQHNQAYSFLALGDSYTIGEAVPTEERFPMQTSAILRAEQFNIETPRIIATTGWTTDELAAGIAAAEVEATYDIVTLLIGVNDQYRGRPVADYEPAFKSLLEQAIRFAGGHNSRVFVLSIPDWGVTPFAEGRDRQQIGQQIDQYNAVNKKIALQYGITYLDITPNTRLATTDATLVAEDGLHPSGKAYQAWSHALAPLIAKALQP
ncbi:lysophospholipase L1-like esterase [Chitinophaga skermanii]|uniref:Lysophospholipase L1-like esterase n=1 Tax=Chitinophaga skermanii TaxID=331697 RepID=A0A327Q6A5_9BACT|nr:SGNH/GDSL hydrolase family protein [Chitinophaga skermanii]RAI99413.1 lysophospholipase L1-like esterase [Chitinophaga skermanii]